MTSRPRTTSHVTAHSSEPLGAIRRPRRRVRTRWTRAAEDLPAPIAAVRDDDENRWEADGGRA